MPRHRILPPPPCVFPCRHPSIHPHQRPRYKSPTLSTRIHPLCQVSDTRPRRFLRSSTVVHPSSFQVRVLSTHFFLSVSSGFWVAIPYRARSEKPLLQKRLLFYLLFLSRRLPASMSCLPSIILRYLRSRHQALSSVASILVSNLVPPLSLPLSPLCIPSISTSAFSHIVDTFFQSPL